MNTYRVEFVDYAGDTCSSSGEAVSPAAAIMAVAARYGHLKHPSSGYVATRED